MPCRASSSVLAWIDPGPSTGYAIMFGAPDRVALPSFLALWESEPSDSGARAVPETLWYRLALGDIMRHRDLNAC